MDENQFDYGTKNLKVIKPKSNKWLYVVLTIIIILLLGILGLDLYNIFKLNTELFSGQSRIIEVTKPAECNCENATVSDENNCENNEVVESKALVIKENKSANYSITWNNGIVTASLNGEKKVVATDVVRYYDMHYGSSDICEGNNVIVMVKSNGSVSALSVDALSCGNKIETIGNFNGLKNYDSLRQKTVNNGEGPLSYSIYGVSADGQEEDITSYFTK